MASERQLNFLVACAAFAIILLPPIYHTWKSECVQPGAPLQQQQQQPTLARSALTSLHHSLASALTGNTAAVAVPRAQSIHCLLRGGRTEGRCSPTLNAKNIRYADYAVKDGVPLAAHLDSNGTSKLLSKHAKALQSRFIKRVQPCGTPSLLKADKAAAARSAVPRPVALVTTVGGGGEFVRRLVEQLSGAMSGSVYRADTHLRREGFFAEGRHDASVVVVATHAYNATSSVWRRMRCAEARKVVVVLSDPFLAVRADFGRCVQQTRKQDGVNATHELRCRESTWPQFVNSSAFRWSSTLESWLACAIPKLVLFLEELQSDRVVEHFAKIARFLSFQLNENTVRCVASHVNALRTEQNERLVPFQFYTADHIKVINERIHRLDALHTGVAQRYQRPGT